MKVTVISVVIGALGTIPKIIDMGTGRLENRRISGENPGYSIARIIKRIAIWRVWQGDVVSCLCCIALIFLDISRVFQRPLTRSSSLYLMWAFKISLRLWGNEWIYNMNISSDHSKNYAVDIVFGFYRYIFEPALGLTLKH